MFNLLRLGQGPRPDLLEKELKQNMNLKAEKQKCEDKDTARKRPKSKRKTRDNLDLHHKDIAAIILALFQLLLPWIAGIILIYFVVILLITKI